MKAKNGVLQLKLQFTNKYNLGFGLWVIGAWLAAWSVARSDEAFFEGVLFRWGVVIFLMGVAIVLVARFAQAKGGTGLRLDEHGLSGYLLPVALRWDDINSFGLVGSQKESVGIGICLHDKSLLGDHLQVMLHPVDRSEPYKYHYQLQTRRLKVDAKDLLSELRAWHETHRTQSAAQDVSSAEQQSLPG